MDAESRLRTFLKCSRFSICSHIAVANCPNFPLRVSKKKKPRVWSGL